MPDPRPVTIANTSPLLYLRQCGLTDLMVKLYEETLVPRRPWSKNWLRVARWDSIFLT